MYTRFRELLEIDHGQWCSGTSSHGQWHHGSGGAGRGSAASGGSTVVLQGGATAIAGAVVGEGARVRVGVVGVVVLLEFTRSSTSNH